MKITLCDDTKSDLIAITNILESYAKKNNFPIEIESNSDPVSLLNKVKMKPEEYKIFFLDIVMGEYNGVDLAAIIKRYCPDEVIVFTTTSKEFAIDAFGVRAFDYLLKPLNKKKVFECIENIVKEMKISLQTAFQIKTKDHSIITVDIKDISYIESLNRRIVFHKKDGDTIDTTSLRSKFIESIPFDYKQLNFINCHASFIVNMNYIKAINEKAFVLKDETIIPISKTSYQEVKKAYIKFLLGVV